MTIHQAKGLEFDHVIVPGLSGSKASRIFPDTSRAEFPPTFGSSLPWWLREDNEGVDEPPTTTKALKVLRERNTSRQEAEEWRLLYVATTRARHSVLFSAAHWYFDTQSPQGPSSFYHWLARQDDLVVSLGSASAASSSPGIGDRERRAKAAQTKREQAATIAALQTATPKRTRRSVGTDQLGLALSTPEPSPVPPRVPQSLPVSALVSLARCARQFHWTHVRPMPRQSSPAAILGTQIHSWIEQLGSGQGSFFSVAPLAQQTAGRPDEGRTAGSNTAGSNTAGSNTAGSNTAGSNTVGTRADDSGTYQVVGNVADRLKESFLSSPYGQRLPVRVEHPIALNVDSLLIRGRVDAAYQDDNDVLNVVDFKTGRPLDTDDPARHVQLDLYGLAALRSWRADEARMRTTAAYLQSDGTAVQDHTVEWSPSRTESVTYFLESSARRIHAGDQQPHVGQWCSRCPYLDLCPEGRRKMNP
jgi:DNA helicase II / ATP-dependent DNA helicase PcrA